MPGPLPDPNRLRRNAPTIPTTKLPAGGRRGPIPNPPEWVELGRAGTAWWKWAWRTPQACAWDKGTLTKVADRATLEDDLAALRRAAEIDGFLDDVLGVENARDLRVIVGHLASLVTGRLGILREIRELDDRLGLSPKGRDQLRLKVVSDEDYGYRPTHATNTAPTAATGGSTVTRLNDRRSRSVDAS